MQGLTSHFLAVAFAQAFREIGVECVIGLLSFGGAQIFDTPAQTNFDATALRHAAQFLQLAETIAEIHRAAGVEHPQFFAVTGLQISLVLIERQRSR